MQSNLTKAIETASKCWCGAPLDRSRQCPRIEQHDALRLLQDVRKPCKCELRHGLPQKCASQRGKSPKSLCRCVCHTKDVRDVLFIEAEANTRPRCFLADGETHEQCTREPSHKDGYIGATGRPLERLRRAVVINHVAPTMASVPNL